METKVLKNFIAFSLVIICSILFANRAVAYHCSSEYCNHYNTPARYDYSDNYYRYDGTPYGYSSSYNSYSSNSNDDYNDSSDEYSSSSNNKPTVVNNYYYGNSGSTAKSSTGSKNTSKNVSNSTATTTSTNKVSTTDGDNSNSENTNLLGASAYNGITALSLKGSGGFMPSSIWQWILTFFLILILVILARIVFHHVPNNKVPTH